MKSLFISAVFLTFSLTAFASRPREAICSPVSPAAEGFFAVYTSSSCSDYVEVQRNVFRPNMSACLDVIMNHTVKPANKNVRKALEQASLIDSSMCVIGEFKPGFFYAVKVVRPADLKVVQD